MVKCAVLLFNSAYLQCKHVPCVTLADKITKKIVKMKIVEKISEIEIQRLCFFFLFHFNS